MIKLLTVFWNIILRKSGPEEVPDSNFLLVVTFIFFLLSQVLVGFKMYGGAVSLFFQLLFLDTVLLIIWLRAILQLSGKLERFRQSLTALFGTGTLFNFILSPFILSYAPYLEQLTSSDELQITAELPMPALLSIVILIIAIWSVLVMGHIYSRATSKSRAIGIGLALMYSFINFMISTSLTVT
ncbi:MAG TPA: hypothetical protein QGG06_04785 [Gammaproteobacteria bacterium]|jgi:hypothetical protein|nr:hypothetical protein [Gammaproteobacteria bacterium]|tara:strand:- start:424 stop:975 length:552 start_codon:yes stop_codon:yes gene_type:complete